MAKEITHKDCLGRNLNVGDCVAVAHRNGLMIATIKKFNPKMIKVMPVGVKVSPWDTGYNKYPAECALLEGPDVTMYLLKKNV